MKHRHAGMIAAAVCAAMLAPAALAQSNTTSGASGNAASRHHDGPRVMMYWQMPIDGGRARPAKYGLRLDSAPLHAASHTRLSLIDFRIQSQSATLHLTGMPVARWSDSSDPLDSLKGLKETMTDPSRPGFYVGWTVVTALVLCAAREVICEKNKSSGGGSTYTTPGS